jgi:hypothetical protein
LSMVIRLLRHAPELSHVESFSMTASIAILDRRLPRCSSPEAWCLSPCRNVRFAQKCFKAPSKPQTQGCGVERHRVPGWWTTCQGLSCFCLSGFRAHLEPT